jgi:ubiquitin-conjugating enzyme E2 W
MAFATKRLGKELQKVDSGLPYLWDIANLCLQIHGNLPPGITLVSAEGFQEWLLDIKVLDTNPLYQNQTYRLKFVFSPSYPIGMFHISSCPLFLYFVTIESFVKVIRHVV